MVSFVVPPLGEHADPSHLVGVPSTLMADALVELMAPYASWPPRRDELEALEDWLQLGAEVWNATVVAKDGAACALGLARLATSLDEEEPLLLVHEIAKRKFALFASDRRQVSAVRVVMRDGRATVETASFVYVSRASK
jgi:hypothetical protein